MKTVILDAVKIVIEDTAKTIKRMLPFIVAVGSLLFTIASLVLSASYLAYRLADERAHREKWEEYDDCGLA